MSKPKNYYDNFEESDTHICNRKKVIRKNTYSISVKGNREAELEREGIFSCLI